MEIIEIDKTSEILKGARYIGHGTTAICFKNKNNRVIKLYRNTNNKRYLFERNMYEHLNLLNEITNESFLGPEIIITSHGQIIGYIYPFKKAKTLARISPLINAETLIKPTEKLIKNTDQISNHQFMLKDLHDKNMLFKEEFTVIDLDQGEKSLYSKDSIRYANRQTVLQSIMHSLFHVKYNQIMYIHSSETQKLYNQMLYEDYQKMREFFKSLKEDLNKQELKISDLRRNRLITKEYNSYYRPF